MTAKYIGRYADNEHEQHIVYLEYEYRGYKYTISENRSKGNEPLSWQHKSEQARIDRLIELEEKEKSREYKPAKTVDEVLGELWEYWNS